MPNPLAAHPPWRQLVIVSVVLPAVITLAVLAFAWPTARIQPRDLPVGVVGSSPGSEQLIEHLTETEPGAFDFHLYPDEPAARTAIRHRDVYGAFFVDQRRVEVLTASAASPAVAQLLDQVGTKLAGATRPAAAGEPTQVSAVDVVPLSREDPNGSVFSSALLPLTICSLIVAAAIGIVVRFRPAWRQLVALTVVSAAAGGGVYLVGQPFLGALPQHPVADWAALTLTVLAMGAATAGLIALLGVGGLGLAAALMVFVGNPFSGVTSAPQLLPDAVNHIGQALPPGAGAGLLRSTAYFNGHAAGQHLVVLITWIVLGIAAIIIGHHAPIQFAANPQRSAPGVQARRSTEEHSLSIPDGGTPIAATPTRRLPDRRPDTARHTSRAG